jgi:hypothetical protein
MVALRLEEYALRRPGPQEATCDRAQYNPTCTTAPLLFPAPCAGNTWEHRACYPQPNSPLKDPRHSQSRDPDNGLPRTR